MTQPDGTPVDLTGETIGSWAAVRWTGETNRVQGTRIWELCCSCGRTRVMSVSDFRSYQRVNRAPRCKCQTEFEQRRVARAEREGARQRVAAKYACPCAGMSWRVPRGRACSCGLRFAPEPAVELVTDSLQSSMGMALAEAPGSFG